MSITINVKNTKNTISDAIRSQWTKLCRLSIDPTDIEI